MAEPAATRGDLVIEDRVVASVGRIAAAEAAGTVVVRRAVGGLAARGLPRARARVAGDRAHLSVEVAMSWPHSLVEVADRVADLVAGRVHELTGLTVDGVDVTVETVLLPDELEPPRRVR